MSDLATQDMPHGERDDPSMLRVVLWLGAGTALLFVAAGGLLWWREGEKLFTDGLIAAVLRCF